MKIIDRTIKYIKKTEYIEIEYKNHEFEIIVTALEDDICMNYDKTWELAQEQDKQWYYKLTDEEQDELTDFIYDDY